MIILQATQLPNTSSCGAIALLNVCLALDLEVDPQLVTEAMFCADSNLKDDVSTCYGDR